jgi:hypothetical protein
MCKYTYHVIISQICKHSISFKLGGAKVRKVTRIIPELRGLSYKQRLEALNLSTLLYRRQRYDMILIFKIIHNLDNVHSGKYFQLNDNLTRGQISKLVLPRINKQLRRNLFAMWCIALLNKLNIDTVLNETGLTFKTKLDRKRAKQMICNCKIYKQQ